MTLEYLQNYWWVLISVLGGILVFLLFVQGGQSMIYTFGRKPEQRDVLLQGMGSKWELTYTTLVVFGGAFFASFPLFYSTCFGGAYWLWILILFSFVLQAVSYEYRKKKGNVYGHNTYDAFLFVNGLVGCVLLGVAVSMFFFGADFTVRRGNLLTTGAPVISQWGNTHGFEAIFNARNLVLGVAVFFLARMQASFYMINRLKDDTRYDAQLRKAAFINGGIFLVFFVLFVTLVCLATGYTITEVDGRTTDIQEVPYKYFHNFIQDWWIGLTLVVGAVLVIYGWFRGCFDKKFRGAAVWFTGIGTFLAVVALFWCAGFNNTPFLPSLVDPASSLTIRNASSSEYTLKAMSYVSIVIPFVLAYIAYVWRKMDK